MSSSGKWIRTSVLLLLAALAVVLIIFLFRSPGGAKQVTVSTILADIKIDTAHQQPDTLVVGSDTLTLTRGGGSNAPQEAANINDTFDVTQVLKDNGIDYTNNSYLVLQYDAPSLLGGWISYIPTLILFLLFGGFLLFMMRQAQGTNNQAMSFGKSRARMIMGNKPTVTFAD